MEGDNLINEYLSTIEIMNQQLTILKSRLKQDSPVRQLSEKISHQKKRLNSITAECSSYRQMIWEQTAALEWLERESKKDTTTTITDEFFASLKQRIESFKNTRVEKPLFLLSNFYL